MVVVVRDLRARKASILFWIVWTFNGEDNFLINAWHRRFYPFLTYGQNDASRAEVTILSIGSNLHRADM